MATLECWSTKPKPKSRSDDDTVEQVLMRSHHRSESDTATATTTTTSTNMQKRFQKLSRNVSEVINSVKNSLNISNISMSMDSSPPSTPRKLVWASIVRNLTQLYPGSQLPEKLVSNIRTHYDSLPPSYAQAGFDMKDVFLHIRLIEQACAEDYPAIVIQPLEGKETGMGTGKGGDWYIVTFASNSAVSWAVVSAALEASSLCCTKYHFFENKTSTLAVLHFPIQPPQDANFKVRVENALRSATKKPKFSNRKLSFGLCGCQQQTAYATDFADADADDHLPDHSYRNSVDHSNANIQLTNPLPSSSLLISVDEWQTVRGRGLEADSWLLSCDAVEFTNQIGPTSFKGVYNAKRVAIEKLKGCDKGNAYDFEIRKDLLELMTCGHRNVLPFYGACIDEFHGLCVVTRFMEGGSVHDFMLKHKKIQIKDVVRIAIDIAEGLKFVNDHGVAYQDLNTQRIFLDRQGNACLGDMGIVRACKSGSEAMEYETDGYRWLAPEIIAADPESVSETWMSNVYSFGMIVWEMINGEAAYSALSPVQAAVGIAACGLRPDIPKDCPQLLKSLMVKCWNNCPSMRPQFSEILSILLRPNSISLLNNR